MRSRSEPEAALGLLEVKQPSHVVLPRDVEGAIDWWAGVLRDSTEQTPIADGDQPHKSGPLRVKKVPAGSRLQCTERSDSARREGEGPREERG